VPNVCRVCSWVESSIIVLVALLGSVVVRLVISLWGGWCGGCCVVGVWGVSTRCWGYEETMVVFFGSDIIMRSWDLGFEGGVWWVCVV